MNKKMHCRLLPILALAAGVLPAQSTTVTYTYNGLPAPVYTDPTDLVTIANIVGPQALAISKVTAQVQIQYPNSGDLKVYLFSPSGTRTILLEHNCSVQNIDAVFDDSAQSTWSDFCPVETGRGPIRGNEPLSNFNSDGAAFDTWRHAVVVYVNGQSTHAGVSIVVQ